MPFRDGLEPDRTSLKPGGQHTQSPLSTSHSEAAYRSPIPLGSLTQRPAVDGAVCADCGSARITQISLTLTDGTPVDFVSCHVCAHSLWISHGLELELIEVLNRTRKAS
jgi:hypothetical protein